jgi:hypothetical protein
MTWCETNVVDYIFGLSANVVLDRWSSLPPMMSGCAEQRAKPRCCAALPRRATQPSRGTSRPKKTRLEKMAFRKAARVHKVG